MNCNYGMVLQLMEWMALQIKEWMNGIATKGWMNNKECMVMDACIYNYGKDMVLYLRIGMNKKKCMEK